MKLEDARQDDAPRGYAHRAYAESLSERGTPILLRRAGGWLLRRPIAGTGLHDAMGCYPLLCCSRWSALSEDLALLEGLVSVSAVTDPLGAYSVRDLRQSFDEVHSFKEHYVVDLTVSPLERLSSHHRREIRRAASRVSVERRAAPQALLADWAGLYQGLVRRHRIHGIAAFSRKALAGQLAVPGLVAYRAEVSNELCGMVLWYADGERCYYHLAACNDLGYRSGAAYALVATALDQLASEGVKWACLGAGAGVRADPSDGLSRFKAGWATGSRTAYLCGRILDQAAYHHLAETADSGAARYFPAYRAGEFEPSRP